MLSVRNGFSLFPGVCIRKRAGGASVNGPSAEEFKVNGGFRSIWCQTEFRVSHIPGLDCFLFAVSLCVDLTDWLLLP
jgi:hypothetical protein